MATESQVSGDPYPGNNKRQEARVSGPGLLLRHLQGVGRGLGRYVPVNLLHRLPPGNPKNYGRRLRDNHPSAAASRPPTWRRTTEPQPTV